MKAHLKSKHMNLQSAMEYLMTYGWAILIISVVLGALFQLGVFNPMTFAPKAPPGACQVFRPNGPYTTSFINLEGICSGEMPQYVAQFNGNFLSNITIRSLPAIAPSTGSSISIALWVDPVSTSNFGGVAIAGPNQQIGWATEYAPNGVKWIYNSNYLAPAGSWTFLVGEETAGGTSALYFNGKLIATGSYNSTVGSSTWVLGAYFSCYGYYGKLANVQIYNTSLSANEIQALYLEGIGGAPIRLQNLVAWYPLDGDANDYSGNGNNGVPTNVIFVSNWYNGYTPP